MLLAMRWVHSRSIAFITPLIQGGLCSLSKASHYGLISVMDILTESDRYYCHTWEDHSWFSAAYPQNHSCNNTAARLQSHEQEKVCPPFAAMLSNTQCSRGSWARGMLWCCPSWNTDLIASEYTISGAIVMLRARGLSDRHSMGARGDGEIWAVRVSCNIPVLLRSYGHRALGASLVLAG